MQRNSRRVGLAMTAALTLTAALMVITASAASAEHGPDLSSTSAIEAYLVSIGVNPADTVWQEGLKNYAGRGCPGADWNCVPANAPIVQVGPAGGTNLFACTGVECVVVQVLLDGGQNASGCGRRDEVAGEFVQICVITQANTTGANAAGVALHIQQTRGSTQRARQIVRITQTNETGSNIARVIESIGQSSRVKGGGAQVQEAHQAAVVTQITEHANLTEMATLGDNTSNIRQIQDQLQRASGDSITQNQNTEEGVDSFCDGSEKIGATPTFDQQKNQCAEVTQDSSLVPNVGGANRSILNEEIIQRQIAERAEEVEQFQGAFSSGEGGLKEQRSSGVSEGTATQDMLQVQTAPPEESLTSLEQDQDTGDPRCCWIQMGNDANRADIAQTTDQTASSDDADQDAQLVATCVLFSGTCHVEQSATTDDDSASQSEDCTAPGPCIETIVCDDGECFTDDEG